MEWLVPTVLSLAVGFLTATVLHIDNHVLATYFSSHDTNRGSYALTSISALTTCVAVGVLGISNFDEILITIEISPRAACMGVLAGISLVPGYFFVFRSLEEGDVVQTGGMILLAPALTYILGYFFLGESMGPWQWVGAGVIVISAHLLGSATGQHTGTLKTLRGPGKALVYMVLSACCVASSSILYKAATQESVNMWAVQFFFFCGTSIAGAATLLLRKFRAQVKEVFLDSMKGASILLWSGVNETLNIVAEILLLVAFSRMTTGSVALLSDGSQPFWVLLIAVVFQPQTRKSAAKGLFPTVLALFGLGLLTEVIKP